MNTDDFKILETRTVFKGRVFDIASEKVLMPSGLEITRDVLLHRGAAAIEVCLMPFKRVLEMAYSMEIRDGKTTVGAILADKFLREQQRKSR